MFNLFKKKIITRIAPSPTGLLHFGTARTALFNYLFAKKNGGKFILRIEDTDKERSTKDFEKNILDGLAWLGLGHDEFYRQSERTEIYKKYLDKLISGGKAYISKETEGDRTEVIRFKNPNKEIVFQDLIRGEIKFNTEELGDFVIAKSITEPLYHLAVVVDDHEMGITHIIRGEDGISNTPRQILIQEAIGAKTPMYAHLPLILGKDRSKMSKRHGPTSIDDFKSRGYLKEAIINQLAFLGWNPGDDREIFSLEDLVKEFDLEKVSKGGAIFNEEKLDWFNKEWIARKTKKEVIDMANKIYLHLGRKPLIEELAVELNMNIKTIEKIMPIVIDEIYKIEDIEKIIKERYYPIFKDTPGYETEKLIWKDSSVSETIGHLLKTKEIVLNLKGTESIEEIKSLIWDYATEKGRGQVLYPLRYLLSGKEKSPDPFTLIYILGKEESLSRIDFAINKLNEKNQ